MNTQGNANPYALLVEDDFAQRKLISYLLEKNRWAVCAVGTGKEAIRVVEDESTSVDLVLLDIMLPGVNGWELSQQITALRPAIKVLFMSTQSLTSLANHHGLSIPSEIFLHKPISERDVMAKLAELCGNEP